MAPAGSKKVGDAQRKRVVCTLTCCASPFESTQVQEKSIGNHQKASTDCVFCVCTQSILERLDAGEIVVGDGGFVFALEKRGYVKAGPWTPEAAAEHPEAGKSRRAKANKITPPPENV